MEVSHENHFVQPFMEVIDDTDKLTVDVCDFITVVKKENGQDYPLGSLYDLVASLIGYVEHQRLDLEVKLISSAFAKVKNTLNHIMAERNEQGLGMVKSKDCITEEQE